MAKSLFDPTPDPGTLNSILQTGQAPSGSPTGSGGMFDMSGPGWQNILMGLALMDAGRPRPFNQQQPLMTTLAPIMQMQAQQAQRNKAFALTTEAMKGLSGGLNGLFASPDQTSGATQPSATTQSGAAPGGLFAPTVTSPDAGAGQLAQGGALGNATAGAVAGDYAPLIQKAAADNNLPADVFAKQIAQESSFNPNAKSPAGALGIAQFMPDTARRFGIDPMDPNQAIPAAAQYVAKNRDMFGGNLGLALAGYNWGEGKVQKWLQSGADPAKMPSETRQYVANITGQPIDAWLSAGGQAPQATAMQGGTPPQQSGFTQFAQATPQTMTDATAAPARAQSPLLVGDSIAGHMITFGGGTGTTDRNTVGKYRPGLTAVNGFTPSQILSTVIPGIPDEQIRGRNVVLSTGGSNDPSQLDAIPQQIAALKQRGASGVTLAGVGTDPKLQGVNDALGKIAQQSGATFAGPLRNVASDGIHSANPAAELSAVQQVMPSPSAAATQGQAPQSFQMPAPGQAPTQQQVAQARALLPAAPPVNPQSVTGAATQRAAAIKAFQAGLNTVIAGGLLGDDGKGIVEAGKSYIDLAKGFLTPTDLQKNIALLPPQLQQQFLIANMDKRPEAQQNAAFAYPGNPAMQQQVVAGSIQGNQPTDLQKALRAIQQLPPNSPERRLAETAAVKAAGIDPLVGGARAGVPGRAYDFATGQYPIAFQNPAMPTGGVLSPDNSIGIAPGALPAIEQSSAAHAAGGATFDPQTFYGPRGQEFQGTRRQLGQVGAIDNAQPSTPIAAPGGGNLSVGGILTPAAQPASPAAPAQRPEAAGPTFPVTTASGQKDISQITIGDMFPGGQGIPQPPAPPPGLGYGKPDAATVDMQKQDVERLNGYNNEASGNQKIYLDLSHLRDVLGQSLNTNNLAPMWANLTNIAHGLGADDLIPKQYDPSNAAEFQKVEQDLTFAAVKKMAGQVRNMEITGFQKANPNIRIPRETNYAIMNDLLSTAKLQDARARLANEYWTTTGHAPLATFDAKFNEMAPLSDVADIYKQHIREVDPNARFPGEGTNSSTAGAPPNAAPPQNAQPAAPVGIAPPGQKALGFDEATARLRAAPTKTNRFYFDQVFGKGASDKVLGR